MSESDSVLIQRLLSQDDADAFSAIVRQYADMVYSTSRRVVGNDAQAADVAQETFFQLLKSADSITGSVGAWLHRVATRRAVDLVRQEAARRQRESKYTSGTLFEVEEWSAVEPLVDEALEELPEEMRAVLVLHYLKGRSMTEIAVELQTSQPTISRRVATALERLREHLRSKDVIVGVAILGTMLASSTQAAPVPVINSLGKLALALAAHSSPVAVAAPAGFIASVGTKFTLAAAVLVLAGGATWYTLSRGVGGKPSAPASNPASAQASGGVAQGVPGPRSEAAPENLVRVTIENPSQLSPMPEALGTRTNSAVPGFGGFANRFSRGAVGSGRFQPGGGGVAIGGNGGGGLSGNVVGGAAGGMAGGVGGFSGAARSGSPAGGIGFYTNFSFGSSWTLTNGVLSQTQSSSTWGGNSGTARGR